MEVKSASVTIKHSSAAEISEIDTTSGMGAKEQRIIAGHQTLDDATPDSNIMSALSEVKDQEVHHETLLTALAPEITSYPDNKNVFTHDDHISQASSVIGSNIRGDGTTQSQHVDSHQGGKKQANYAKLGSGQDDSIAEYLPPNSGFTSIAPAYKTKRLSTFTMETEDIPSGTVQTSCATDTPNQSGIDPMPSPTDPSEAILTQSSVEVIELPSICTRKDSHGSIQLPGNHPLVSIWAMVLVMKAHTSDANFHRYQSQISQYPRIPN